MKVIPNKAKKSEKTKRHAINLINTVMENDISAGKSC
jgi:hypothetical protein